MPISQIQDSDIARCINLCLTCSRICHETFNYCVEQKGTAYSGKHLSLLQYCADSCNLTAKLLMAEVNHFHQSCELTFELCNSAAVECERYDGDQRFTKCAQSLRETAELCRRLAGMTVRVPFQEVPRTQTQASSSH